MNTMKWLLRREFWEHKGTMLWAPLLVAAVIVAVMTGTLMYGTGSGILEKEMTAKLGAGGADTLAEAFNTLAPAEKAKLAGNVADGFLAPAAPLFIMMGFSIFFYCLNSLSEERRDRSILFWKSLPVSDNETVLSKVLVALVVIPVITIGVSVFMSLLLLLIGGIAASIHGIHMIGPVLGNGEFYLTPLRLIGLLPVYIVWALPTIGWLVLVSAWAKSKVFLWAVVAPLIAVAIVKWTTYIIGAGINVDWLLKNVVSRGLLGMIPGSWIPLSGISPSAAQGHAEGMHALFIESWSTLMTAPAMIGAAAGLAMLYGAARVRRWQDEG